jgi:acyl carrier protein
VTVTTTSSVRLLRTMAAVLGVDDDTLNDESSPDTVPTWDSLNHLNVVLALEQEFAIELSTDDVMSMVNLAVIRSILRGYGVEV